MKHLFYALGRRTLMLAVLVGFFSATWAEKKHYYYDFEGNYLSDNVEADEVKNTESVVDYEFDADTETLYLCKSLNNIYKDITLVMPLNIDGKSITTIATGAFSESTYKYGINVNAREIVFPPNVRNLESDIFNGGSAAYIIDLSMSNINNMNIHNDAFSGCYNLLNFEGCYIYYSDGDCTKRNKARAHDVCYSICPKTKQLEMTYFELNELRHYYNIDGSRTIANDIMGTNCKLNGCLKGKWNIYSLWISEGLTSLGDEEFEGCANMMSLVLPKTFDMKNFAAETTSTCGDRVFDNCGNLTCIYVFSCGVPYKITWLNDHIECWAYVNNGSEWASSKDQVYKNPPNRMLTDTDSKIAIYPDIQFVKGYVARFYNSYLWYDAFKDNTNITEVTIYGKRDANSKASLVALLDRCFEGCTSLEKVVSLSDELRTIGENCFKNCPKLNYMSFARGVSVDTGAFDGDDNLTTIHFVKDSTDVGLRYHYTWTKATSVTLPDATFNGQTVADNMPEGPKTLLRRIEKIGDATDTADNRIYDPANNVPAFAPKAGISAPLYMMCDGVFKDDNLYSVFNLPAETTLFGNDCFNVYNFNNPLKINLTYNGLRYESKYLTGDNTGCMSATLTDIPDHDVTDLVIPYDFKVSNVTCFTNAIAEGVGQDYTALKTLEFAPSTKIYNAGASYNKGLEIGGSAFSGCRALTTLTLPAGTKEYTYTLTGGKADAGAFGDCTSLRSVDLTNCTDIWYRAFNNCTSLRSVRFGSKLANASLAFHDCSSLTSVVFPNTVGTTYNAFKGCEKLKTMVYTFDKTDADKYAKALQYAKDLVAYVAKNRGIDTDDLKVYVPADNLQDFEGIQGVAAAAMTDYRFLPATASDGTQLVEGYGTVCLPSAIDIAASYNIRGLYKAQLNSDNTAVTLAEQTQDDVVAGMPYVFARNNSGSASADADNLVVFVAKDDVDKADFPVVDVNNILRGTFSGMSAKDGDYVLQSDNKFHVVNTSVYRASVGAYRAYINGLNIPASASTASMFALNIGGSATGIGGINASGNAGANAADAKIYTIDGQRVYAPVKGQVYIIGGKKRVY